MGGIDIEDKFVMLVTDFYIEEVTNRVFLPQTS